MSTDMQIYSIENQSEAISIYAARNGLTIIKSYEDGGKSGVRLEGRAALQSLLADVESGRADFSTVLVYDVSRWGRFQDADESAHYEFLCKRAGVSVHYCAEQFINDGSLSATVIKNIKRAMAGEFSRELSEKTFLGKRRIVLNGYSAGTIPGYGLRRMLLDEQGNRKFELQTRQWKSLQTERVILVPGPSHETAVVTRMFDLCIDDGLRPAKIAQQLNEEGVLRAPGRPWTYTSIKGILTNEKYIGNAVFNRTSKKLSGRWRRNPEQEWIRREAAYEAVVAPERFKLAQVRLAELSRKPTRKDLLDALTALWCSSGRLTGIAVEKSSYTPSPPTYVSEFGSLAKAFRAVGFRGHEIRGYNADIRKSMLAAIVDNVSRRGGSVVASPMGRQLTINNEFTVSICVSRIRTRLPRVWQFGYVSKQKPDVLLAARIEGRHGPVSDYLVLPFMYLPHGAWVTMSASSGIRLDRFRTKTLAPFFDLCARTAVKPQLW